MNIKNIIVVSLIALGLSACGKTLTEQEAYLEPMLHRMGELGYDNDITLLVDARQIRDETGNSYPYDSEVDRIRVLSRTVDENLTLIRNRPNFRGTETVDDVLLPKLSVLHGSDIKQYCASISQYLSEQQNAACVEKGLRQAAGENYASVGWAFLQPTSLNIPVQPPVEKTPEEILAYRQRMVDEMMSYVRYLTDEQRLDYCNERRDQLDLHAYEQCLNPRSVASLGVGEQVDQEGNLWMPSESDQVIIKAMGLEGDQRQQFCDEWRFALPKDVQYETCLVGSAG